MSQLSSSIDSLAGVPSPESARATALAAQEAQLAQARLGIGSSLLTALRCKHAQTAAHCLRVALGCSAWSFALDFAESDRDELELAALLHDIGKIGVPDSILLKPDALDADETALMERYRIAGLDILRGCCASQSVFDMIWHSSAWFDGSRPGFPVSGRQISLGARMLSIVDAFDSMTSAQVYRRALSRDRATAELFRFAGSQFDPDLVKLFFELHEKQHFQDKVAQRWLRGLDPQQSNVLWQFQPLTRAAADVIPADMFQEKLLENMHDAVAFVDHSLKILRWNPGAERLTGISGEGVYQRCWKPGLLRMRNERGNVVADDECPVAYAIQTGVQSLRRLIISGRSDRSVAVDLHVMPVVGPDGVALGAAVVLHDASPEASLEQRCQNLHERATKDPLTQVANRAEFDRTHQMFVAAHLERRLPCSLIMCDIDHFKKINDIYGHQAGDEALKSFAQLLKNSCRPGDLVARYGGEEFVLLCADCNNATAAQRAERLRRTVSELPQSMLDGKRMTVSFGVTEVQPGDTPETMLRRADRALLEAKDRGRNAVVQLGSGIGEAEEPPKRRFWWFGKRTAPDLLIEQSLVTTVPMKVAIEKLRGFVVDHHAQIISIEDDTVHLKIEGQRMPFLRRSTDRVVPFLVELKLKEDSHEAAGAPNASRSQTLRTRLHVVIRPKRDRDRRRKDAIERARNVVASIKSYLMASDDLQQHADDRAPKRATNVVVPWLRKKD